MFLKKLMLLVCVGWLSTPVYSSGNSTIATTATTSSPVSTNISTTLLPTGSTPASCAANNGSCGNVTTLAPKAKKRLDKWKHEQLQPSYYKFKMSNRSDCDCDLHNRFCDINCCCDKDCSLEAKQVFSFCMDAINLPTPNSKYCNYMQYIYNNRTLYEEEVQQSSLFCIVKSNLPAHYYKQKKKIILNPLHANVAIKESSSYQWSNSIKYTEDKFLEKSGNFTNRTALFGDAIYVLKNYSIPQKLELAASFITPDCITTKEVHYLQDFKTTCKLTLHDRNFQLFLQSFNSNWTVLSSLRFLNNSLSNYEGCPKNVCIPFNIKQCDLNACWNMTNSTTSGCTTKMCMNIVTKVKYTFIHNGTNGIQRVDLGLTLDNVSLPTSSVDQEYEVKFLWTNQTEFNYSDHRSGNPGYQIGKPILFGKLITVMNITTNSTTNKTIYHETQYLKRQDVNYIDNFLVLPKNVGGKCTLSPFVYENINFGYNMLTKCVHGQGFVKRANTTANETCWLLQNNILAYWSLDVDQNQHKNTTSNATFGYFGNAQNGNLKDWGYFLFDAFPEELLNNTYGRDIGIHNIACQNISTGIKYNVFYERVEYEQNRIAAVYVEFSDGQRVDLNVLHGNVFSDVPLRSEAMFYDVTGVRDRKYVDPPALDIKLPYDFFYPFIRIENQAITIGFSYVNIILVLSVGFMI